MSWTFSNRIDLGGSGRISVDDAARQTRTAREILRRLDDRPGIVLADEVGMGKTFVALAVAASVVLGDAARRPVVVMVPSGLQSKWPREWEVFSARCLRDGHGIRATSQTIRRGSDFLKLLDDPDESRAGIIFMTHTALAAALRDPFMKLALLRQALRYQRNGDAQRRAVSRWGGDLLNHAPFRRHPAAVGRLLVLPADRWRGEWERLTDAKLDDEPVPESVMRALESVDLQPVRDALAGIPLRTSAYLKQRLREARRALDDALDATWRHCMSAASIHLPLLILDEAHHLKNPNQLAGLFADADARNAASKLSGPLNGVFERMLFLTATPFQLGHRELLNVLDRFGSVAWVSEAKREEHGRRLAGLRDRLDHAQASALRLDRAWGRLTAADVVSVPADWWRHPDETLTEAARIAADQVARTEAALRDAETELRPWVIRHLRSDRATHRRYEFGKTIIGDDGAAEAIAGLDVPGEAVLPFLLAARAQAVVSLAGATEHHSAQSLFAGGIASSFEAYVDTRKNRPRALDDDATPVEDGDLPATVSWYLDRVSDTLRGIETPSHPKIEATTERVRRLWAAGEKCLVFCFYRETGRALRLSISRALRAEVISLARRRLGLPPGVGDGEVLDRLRDRGDGLLRSDSAGGRHLVQHVEAMGAENHLGADDATRLGEITLSFLRTDSYLARYIDLDSRDPVHAIETALAAADQSRMSLEQKVRSFGTYAASLEPGERRDIFDALAGIQTGERTITALDLLPAARSQRRESVLPNVRLVNGATDMETRRRLMLAFNTPLFPEVLVASSVMGEGVDLHLDCRFVIHHDLDWNPSVLEQRTGRLDRINSKAERAAQPIVIFEPFIAGFGDERQFRVVRDRERWFELVMGGSVTTDDWSTDRAAERVELPAEAVEALRLDLSVPAEDE